MENRLKSGTRVVSESALLVPSAFSRVICCAFNLALVLYRIITIVTSVGKEGNNLCGKGERISEENEREN